jgi:hypothetical protein
MATGEVPARPGAGLPAAIDVPSYETPVVPPEPEPPVPAADDEPEPVRRAPARKLSPEELVTESTRLAVGAVFATGRGLRSIVERAVAAVEESQRLDEVAARAAAALPDGIDDYDDNDDYDDAVGADLGAPTARSSAAAPAAVAREAQELRPPVAALRPPPVPDTVLGALPTAALGAGLQAQRELLAALIEARRLYGPSLTWMLEAPGVSTVYQRARSSVFVWYRRGAAEKEQGASLALASLKEVSDEGLGYVFHHLDLNTILHGFNINPLLENLELNDVILSSTGGLATEALDNVRSQGVTVDDVISRVSNRLFRRKPEKVPQGPTGKYGVRPELPPWANR